ncbi:hypothetical protein ACN28I_00055 [Archangium gephyra]|uniref:hypothetical protein n=1 Tax=Archangium gephyra TaxID=48 RepID=UPI003B78984A
MMQARELSPKLTRGELASRLKLEGSELESRPGLVRSRLDLSSTGRPADSDGNSSRVARCR